ncbi:hypothetical protein PsYK624_007460 [Phanerochaete sordida]|uniref:C2 domain-containing protein n=1 Tax=Phanerochaete sordida TaxID=48140 RepID=A0A9P3L788_9APHY|nr:hypothetical protein PsYK624_007460 [Phanerochaete sordida]
MNLKSHWTPSPGALGTLIVVILKARNLPNKRHIGKQDPYCLVRFDGEKQRTRAIKRGGQHPEWDEEFRYELWEDDGPENVAPPGPNGTPPLPPPKKKGPLKIKGGRFLHVACYAEDLREPDFIGETKVDLTEVLTKGETDEWFTLMNKDKYSGEVYVELTFWSNEPEPEQKTRTKAKANRHYGGPGQFTPADDSLGQSNNTFRPGSSHASQLSSSNSLYDIARREAVPPSLRPSSSLAKVDLYKAPYETNRSHQSIASMDSVTNDFGQLTMQPNGNRRTSMPHMPSGFQSRQSTMSSSSSVHLEPSQTGFGNDPYAYPAQDGQSYPPVSPNPTGYQPFPTQPAQSAQPAQPPLYNPPYETPRPGTVMPGYVRQARRSLPPTSSGFVPTAASSGFVPVPASSGFVPVGQHHTGYYPPVSATPAPMQNYAPPPPPGHTPHPSLYSAHPPPAGPAPTPASSNFSSHSQQYPASSGFAPSGSYQNIPPQQQPYGYQYTEPPQQQQQQQYAQPQPYPHAPLRPPTTVNSQHPLPHPPTPPTMQQHTHSAPPDHNTGYDQSAYANVPPPPPLPNNQSPARAHGSRPLPIPGQPQVRRRHSTIGMQPQPVASHITGMQPGSAYNPYSQVPPPPMTSSFSTSSLQNQGWQPPPPPPLNGSTAPYPPVYQQQQPVPGPPPLPARAPSRAQPQPPPQQQQQQPYQPPPSRRQSFSHGGPVYAQTTGQAHNPPPPPPPSLQPRFQQVPPPPPSSASYGGGSTSHTMALAQSGFASAHSSPTQPPYPGPLPVPPQVPASQSHHGYAVANGGWQ